jgi:hypothetical protein
MTWNEATLLNPPNPECCNTVNLCPKCTALLKQQETRQQTNNTGRNAPLRMPKIDYKGDYEARLAAVRNQATPATKPIQRTINSRPKSEREKILPKMRMTYENPLTRQH